MYIEGIIKGLLYSIFPSFFSILHQRNKGDCIIFSCTAWSILSVSNFRSLFVTFSQNWAALIFSFNLVCHTIKKGISMIKYLFSKMYVMELESISALRNRLFWEHVKQRERVYSLYLSSSHRSLQFFIFILLKNILSVDRYPHYYGVIRGATLRGYGINQVILIGSALLLDQKWF